MKHNDLYGERMKSYEEKYDLRLEKKEPVIIRIDGRAFHTWTKGLKKPFDEIFIASMQDTMRELCSNVEGCVFGYTQSDEITLVLVDYATEEQSSWFDYRVQKICSVVSSMTTKYFSEAFSFFANDFYQRRLTEICQGIENSEDKAILCVSDDFDGDLNDLEEIQEELEDLGLEPEIATVDSYDMMLIEKMDDMPCFDARCYNVPIDEVCNVVYWRQVDAIRNSIQAVGQANFSAKELFKKSTSNIKEMLKQMESPIDWDNDIPVFLQRGSACHKVKKYEMSDKTIDGLPVLMEKSEWEIDFKMPLLKDDRAYLESLVKVGKYKEE